MEKGLVFIALGSNLETPISQIQRAFNELGRLADTQLIKHSSLYRSAPVGRLDLPDFINAAPRTLDLDILQYDTLQCNDAGLIIPHPRMTHRAFVLQPLMEIAPDCQIPGYGPIAPLLAACKDQELLKINS